jgi:hypothetical protein
LSAGRLAVAVGTVVSCSHVAFARVLAASLQTYRPDAAVVVCVADGDVRDCPEVSGARVVTPRRLGLDRDELQRMAAIYDAAEFACALKPLLLRKLVDEVDVAVYLDADIQVHGPLDALVADVAQAGLVLVPHLVAPPPDDGLIPDEHGILVSGIYNGGMLGVSRRAKPFLRWWDERCARRARNRPAEGEVLDQRWLTIAAGYFPHAVLRDPAYDVAYWNMPPRRLDLVDGAFTVDGAPLQAFHFSGFDPLRPFELSRYDGPTPRIVAAEQPPLAALCEAYATALRAAGHDDAQRAAYGYSELDDGVPIDGAMRAVYRDALLAAERAAAPAPPNPFADAAGFRRWLASPDDLGRGRRHLNRWAVRRVAEDRELAERYGDLRSTAAAYRDALAESGAVPAWLLPPPVQVAALPVRAPGANLAVRSAATVLEATLRTSLEDALAAAGEPVAIVSDDVAASRAPAPFPAATAVHDATVYCLPVDAILTWNHIVGDEFHAGRRHAVYTAWPGGAPEGLSAAARFVDEIWVPAEGLAGAPAIGDTPVHVVPAVLTPPPLRQRAALGLPAGFLVVTLAADEDDGRALRAIDAFVRAFPDAAAASLVVVADAVGRRRLAALRAAAADRPEIHIRAGARAGEDRRALVGAADVYLALPAAPAVGLDCLEAVAAGVRVIAADHVRAVAPYGAVAHVPVVADGSPDTAAAAAAMVGDAAHAGTDDARRAEARAACAAHGVERAAEAVAARLAAWRAQAEERPRRFRIRIGRQG